VTTVPANSVRIPSAAREALARREVVLVVSHGRPAYIILSSDAYHAATHPPAQPAGGRGRRLREALEILSGAPSPDPRFGADLEAIRASAGDLPPDPWARS